MTTNGKNGPRRLAMVLMAVVAGVGACGVRSAPVGVVPMPVLAVSAADAAPRDTGLGATGASTQLTPDTEDEQRPGFPVREFRGAWVSPVWSGNLHDWPSRTGLSAEAQQAELRGLFDRAKALGLNAVILHVRMAGDAMYPNTHAPWSAFLTGRSGGHPGYDPLAFAIAEAHARGLQLHAWFNPFRAMLPNFVNAAHGAHVTRARPEWIRRYGTQTWIDPGDPSAQRHVLDAIVDVVRRYDIDGVHIDDYFYPYREQEQVRVGTGRSRRTVTRDIPFPDDRTWARYGEGRGFATRADWRRANVDAFVKAMHQEVKREKPWLLVGISPFGIWRPGSPPGITGLDAFGEIYADARKWLREGWADYVAPQLYWELDGTQRRFSRLDAWWRTQNPKGRHIWPGLHTARVIQGRQRWSVEEIPAQIEALRAWRAGTSDAPGHVHFRLAAIAPGSALEARIRAATPGVALVPAAPWLGAVAPAAPAALVERDVVRLTPGDETPVAWWLVQSRPQGSAVWRTELVHATTRRIPITRDGAGRVEPIHVTPISRTGVAGGTMLVGGR